MSSGQMSQLNADWGFLLDPLSSVMVLVVTGVGFLIHLYSVGYMAHEGGYYRFFGYLNLFMFSMLTLILANNYLLPFVKNEHLVALHAELRAIELAEGGALRLVDVTRCPGADTIRWTWPGRICWRPVSRSISPTGPSSGIEYGVGRTVRSS